MNLEVDLYHNEKSHTTSQSLGQNKKAKSYRKDNDLAVSMVTLSETLIRKMREQSSHEEATVCKSLSGKSMTHTPSGNKKTFGLAAKINQRNLKSTKISFVISG